MKPSISYIALISAILLTSCATRTAYYSKLDSLVSSEKYSEAVAFNETSKEKTYGKKNALLYYLDRGMLLHFSGEYEDSNLAFEKAKRLAEEYFTKSITAEASTLLISDNMRPYYGEDFERALVHVFSALNYVFLGMENEALVEARQVDHFLKTLKVDYGHKNTYLEDAFVRYLMGMLYENQGEINDAFISYRKALDAYDTYYKYFQTSAPPELVADALRTARILGFKDEIRQIKDKWKKIDVESPSSSEGELVVLHYNGFSPVKIDHFFEISFNKGWLYVESMDVKGEDEEKVEQARSIVRSIASDEQIRLAFPKYVPQDYKITNFDVSTPDSGNVPGVLVEDIGNIAVKGLEERINRIRARTIARGVIKFVLAQKVTKKVEKSSGELSAWFAKTILKTVSAATELSDKRSWRSLPDEIFMARVPLKEGVHSVNIKFYNKANREVSIKTIDDIKIRKGKKTFVAVRTAL
ncbi:MAG: hypothetical protein JW871_01545 [Endomicrobiales bacterium]|nr:hypothetical protein [Endomicrobiales bacterium]